MFLINSHKWLVAGALTVCALYALFLSWLLTNGNYELVCAKKTHFQCQTAVFPLVLKYRWSEWVGGGLQATEKGVFNFSLAQSRASH